MARAVEFKISKKSTIEEVVVKRAVPFNNNNSSNRLTHIQQQQLKLSIFHLTVGKTFFNCHFFATSTSNHPLRELISLVDITAATKMDKNEKTDNKLPPFIFP